MIVRKSFVGHHASLVARTPSARALQHEARPRARSRSSSKHTPQLFVVIENDLIENETYQVGARTTAACACIVIGDAMQFVHWQPLPHLVLTCTPRSTR